MSFVLAGYVDVEQIGRGGIGDVYRARRASTGATVAIKVLRDVSDGSAAWRRARRELAALVSLAGHAHVVQVEEVLEVDGRPALVMEHLPGGSVGALLAGRGGALDPDEVTLVAIHAARALVAAHERGIVHRDVKPHNLLIDGDGQVKLCDFGVAAIARSSEFRDPTTALSMRYASPEDLDGLDDRRPAVPAATDEFGRGDTDADTDDPRPVGPPSDVYSLGATLLHLAHGAPPTLRDRLSAWTPPSDVDRSLAELDGVIAGCLRPEPGERPTACELLAELERFADRLGAPEALAHPLTSADPPVDRGVDADATAHRRPGPPRPVPAVVDSGRRRAVVVAGVAVAAVAVLAAARIGGGAPPADELAPAPAVAAAPASTPSLSAPAPTTSSTPPAPLRHVARPLGLEPLASVAWPFGAVGECLLQFPAEPELRVVGCAAPHDLQRFATGRLGPGPPDAIAAGVVDACAAHLRALAGPDALPDGVAIASTRPSADAFEAGDRSYQCLVGVPGRRSIGDLLPAGAIDGGRDDAVGSRR